MSPAATAPLDGEGLRRLVAATDADRSSTFRIVLSDRGGSLRTLVGAGRRHMIGVGRVPGAGHGNPFEGVTERELDRLLVADPDVVAHRTQPCRFDLVVDGTLTSYLPDYWALYRDLRFEFGEVKVHPGAIGDAVYVAKLFEVRRRLALLDCDFVVRYRKGILGSPTRQENVAVLHYDRAANLDRVDRRSLRSLEGVPNLTFLDVASLVVSDGGPPDRAAVRRLVTLGRVWIDLDRLLTDRSPAMVRKEFRPASPFGGGAA